MLILIGTLVIIGAIYFLIKRKEARMILFAAGLLMAIFAGKPMAAFEAFTARMSTAGLIEAILSVMGFAFVMKYTKCDLQLVKLVAGGLKKANLFLIPGATLATFAINIALPSAAGAAAAVGAVLIPVLMGAGISPAVAAAAVIAGTFGSNLNVGSAHNPFIAEIAQTTAMDVVKVHAFAHVLSVVILAVSLTIMAKLLKENKGHKFVGDGENDNMKLNYLYALMPIIPLVLLVLGSTILPQIAMSVPAAMLIGILLTLAVTRSNPSEVTKTFFDGMGKAYGDIMGIIIAAAVFVGGMTAIGLVDAMTEAMTNSPSIAKVAATFGPFLLAVISGSGDAATFAFNEAVTPFAEKFGVDQINMGSVALLSGALGRTMSPIAGAAIVCASIAKVNPMELTKRNAPGVIIAVIISMFILL
ncbi:C4-dicarboxylate transporter DcuC [Mesobacillus subterraneus]|uniref:C4-dicarboxylate transporter DcuC n=1 Tax=Mesobacillus subterraneus TaxID=285983 RepID=UPI00273EDB07|nr:C4-dicarboxylate transporter DcuC [Mesobacillus subterraneus]WLR54555.1 C4-dicarboxylate transporter DcuC [Mesobacillus subterraneus]